MPHMTEQDQAPRQDSPWTIHVEDELPPPPPPGDFPWNDPVPPLDDQIWC